MRAPIAKIRISAGNPGWYDPLTNIHLTITRPEAIVYEGQNVSNIKNAIVHKLVFVTAGDIDAATKVVPAVAVNEVREVIDEPVKEKVVEPVEEIKEVVEEVKEEKVEEVVEEKKKPAKKASTKKKTTKKTEITE